MTGLRGRMIAALVVTSLATLAAAALVFAPLLSERLENDRLHELRDLIRTIRPTLRATSFEDREGLLEVAARLERRAGGRIVILDDRGRTLADTAPPSRTPAPGLADLRAERAAALAHPGHIVSGARGRVAFAASVVRAEDVRLTLVIAKRLDDTRAAVSVVRAALPVSVVAGLAVAAILAVLLSRGLLRRLRRLAGEATLLGTSGLHHPVAVEGRDEIATVARALESMRGRLADDEAERVAFLATASHELRTPLASLQATLELLREETLHDEATKAGTLDRTDTALRSTHRLVALATDLLELSRQDSRASLAADPVDVAEVAAGIAREADSRLAASGRSVEVSGAGATAVADQGALARIIAILLDNAGRHGAGTIRLDVARADGEVVLGVEDDGPGLDPGDRERAFARFERGRAAASGSGAGLGLPIARGLAEAMGGRLDVVGDLPLNRFELRLPVARPVPQESPSSS
ncbi:MAG: HAMP domain-containing sensor histidine kinase [Solirubrobacteraceae bacterium]